jgi:hypothetical protein
MARRYSRDNRGRFASAGTGATARGGRLKTASGGRRATRTSRMAAATRTGTVAKPRGVSRGAVAGKVKPRAVRVPRVNLTKENIQNRITRRSVNQKNRSKGVSASSARKQSNFLEVTRRRQAFSDYISKKARYETSRDFVKAFKDRPRYSTRQKIKPSFNYAVSSWTGMPK